MSLAYTDLEKGVLFVLDGAPYEGIEMHFLRMQQRKAVVQTRIRNLITGKLLDRNWQASDSFEEAEIERKWANFIYQSKGEYWFHEEGKPNARVNTWLFNDKVIKIEIPIKMDLKVTEAPPAIRGNTSQGGTKVVTVEGGAKVN